MPLKTAKLKVPLLVPEGNGSEFDSLTALISVLDTNSGTDAPGQSLVSPELRLTARWQVALWHSVSWLTGWQSRSSSSIDCWDCQGRWIFHRRVYWYRKVKRIVKVLQTRTQIQCTVKKIQKYINERKETFTRTSQWMVLWLCACSVRHDQKKGYSKYLYHNMMACVNNRISFFFIFIMKHCQWTMATLRYVCSMKHMYVTHSFTQPQKHSHKTHEAHTHTNTQSKRSGPAVRFGVRFCFLL